MDSRYEDVGLPKPISRKAILSFDEWLLTTDAVHDILQRTLGGTVMSKVPSIVPITDLRQDAATVLRRIRDSKEPVIITQRGRAAAVMMSTEAYARAEHDRELLRRLAQGEKEIAAGKGYDLAAVLAEADALLARG